MPGKTSTMYPYNFNRISTGEIAPIRLIDAGLYGFFHKSPFAYFFYFMYVNLHKRLDTTYCVVVKENKSR